MTLIRLAIDPPRVPSDTDRQKAQQDLDGDQTETESAAVRLQLERQYAVFSVWRGCWSGGGVWSASFWAVMGVTIVTPIYLSMWNFGLLGGLTYIRDRVTWSLIKLERIERGLEPK